MKDIIMKDFRALLKAIIISSVLCLLIGSIINLTSLSENYIIPLSKIIFAFTVFLGALFAAQSYGSKGLLKGINSGVLFFILVALLTILFSGIEALTISAIFRNLFECMLVGALGGIVGIGFSK